MSRAHFLYPNERKMIFMETRIKIDLGEIAPQISEELERIRKSAGELYHAAHELYMKLGYDIELGAKPDAGEK